MILLLVFVTAFVSALALTPLAMALAARTGAIAFPDARRKHAQPTPRFGGFALFVAFLLALGVSLIYPRSDPDETARLLGLLLGGACVFIVGAYDDHRELKALPQLVAQFIAAAIAIGSGVLIRQLQNPFGDLMTFESWFAIVVTLFWLVGMMNTINWLDGIDGLAAGVVAIAAGVMCFHSYLIQRQDSIAMLAIALAGATIGFLKFNFFPAKIFMGTAGALVLGYALGVISIIGGAKVATALLVLFIPVLDVAWQIIARVRAGKSPFQADRGHLHHRLLDLGLSQRAIVWMYYCITAVFGALALFLPHAASKLFALIVIGIGAVMTLFRLRAR